MRFLRDQGLAITMFGIFAVTMVGLVLTGWNNYNGEQIEHRCRRSPSRSTSGLRALRRGGLRELGERVPADGRLRAADGLPFQRGSSESKDPDSEAAPRTRIPARRQAEARALAGSRRADRSRCTSTRSRSRCSASSSASFVLHAVSGAGEYSEEQLAHGGGLSRRSNISARRDSGSSRSRTGRASSWPSGR